MEGIYIYTKCRYVSCIGRVITGPISNKIYKYVRGVKIADIEVRNKTVRIKKSNYISTCCKKLEIK